MDKNLFTGLKNNYLDYLEDILSNRSLCTQIKLNLLKKYFNEIIDMIENIISKKRLFDSFLTVNKVHNYSFNNNLNQYDTNINSNNNSNNMINNMNNNIINGNLNNSNISNNDIDNMNNNNMYDIINNNDFNNSNINNNYIDNMKNNNINNMYNNNFNYLINMNNMNNMNNNNIMNNSNINNMINNNMNNNDNMNDINNYNNINMNSNNKIVNNTSRRKLYILKIDNKKKLKNILTYLDNLGNKYYCLCTEQNENNNKTLWLLLEFEDKFKLHNEFVYNSIFNFKAYHSSEYYNFILSKGRKINLKKIK